MMQLDALIRQELERLEQEKHIHILLAVESGSRAWGFASQDSDWDVRFIYCHPVDWYLSIDDKKDSMEFMLDNDLDLSGWELRKALKLFRKSNPPLLEWLSSPIVYFEEPGFAKQMRRLAKDYFNPKSCRYHYLSMAKGNYRGYLQGDTVKLKKYFYALRPLLACDWIEEKQTMAPIEFHVLLEDQINDSRLKNAIEWLLRKKMAGDELSEGPRIPEINDYVQSRIAHHEKALQDYSWQHQPDTVRLNELFRDTIRHSRQE